MVSKFTSLNSSGLHLQRTFGAMIMMIMFSLAWTNANAQCDVMVTNTNVVLTATAGGTATLDAAAVAGNITAPGAGCTIFTFSDELDNPFPPGAVTLNCDGTTAPFAGTYFLRVGDGAVMGNRVQFTVTIDDTTKPTFTTPADVTVSCEVDLTPDATPASPDDVTDEMDNCATGIEATYSDTYTTAVGCNGTGTIERLWRLDDGNGNVETDIQTIVVQDVTQPTFTPPANVTITCGDDINDLMITGDVTMIDDNCSTNLMATYVDAPPVAGACPTLNTIERTWTLVDSCFNATNLKQMITREDMTAPTSTKADTTVGNDAGMCSAMVTVILDATNTSDVCDDFADLVISNDFTAGGADASGTYPSGMTTTVTFTLMDLCGNTSMHEVKVTVNDTLKPIISACPMDVVFDADPNDCDNTYSWTAPTASTTCGSSTTETIFSNDPSVLINKGTPGPGRVDFADFPVGVSTVGYAFEDTNGNRDTCTFTVTILDNQPPVINCPPDQNLNFGSCTPAASLLVPDYRSLTSVSDNCSGANTVTQSPAPNSLLSAAVASLSDGEMFTVTMTAMDNNPNNGTDMCTFEVTLVDTNLPVPDVGGASLPNATSTCGPLEFCAPTATNSCGGLVVGEIVPTGSLPAGVTQTGTCSAPCAPNPSITGTLGTGPGDLVDAGTTSFNINVAGLGAGATVDDVEFSLEVSHSWVGDLSATLTSPSGTKVTLFNLFGPGCTQDNVNLILSDDAMDTAADLTGTCNASVGAGNYAVQGTFQPVGSFSDFDGDLANGTWVLEITDNELFISGVLESFSLDLCTLTGAVVPQYTFDPGTYNLTWEYDDGSGNTTSQTQTISVANDAVMPVINCSDITVELDAAGNAIATAGATVGEAISVVSGNDLGVFSPGNVSYCVSTTAATTISFAWDYNSADGNAVDDQFGYTINGVFTALATGTPYPAGTYIPDPASLQQSGVASVNLSAGDDFCFRANTSDNFGGSSTTQITNFQPGFAGDFAAANWSEVKNNAISGSASLSAPDITDNCAVDFSTLMINGQTELSLDCSDLGTFAATITVEDVNGNAGTCMANITVIDLTAPTFSGLPTDMTISCSDPIGMPSVSASDVCDGTLNVVLNEVSTKTGNPATCGDYNYTISREWTVTDNSGNSSVASQTMTIEDNDAPTNPVFSDNLVGGTIGSDPVNCSANVSLSLTGLTDCAPFANITVTNDSPFATSGGADASGTYPVGVHNVNFTVSDPCGNTVAYNRSFTVEDDDGPIAVCIGLTTIGLPSSGVLTLTPGIIDNGSVDNCGSIVSMSISPTTFGCADADGVTKHIVTLTVVDDSGNTATCDAEVIIQDNDAPQAICKDVTVELDQSGNASIVLADINGGSTDNCTDPNDLIFSISQTMFTVADAGSTVPVTLTVEDSNGNTDDCTANVKVEVPQTCFNVGTAFGATGSIVSVPIRVENFTNVLNFQYTVIMGTGTTGELLGVSGSILPPAEVNIIENVISTDTLTISWSSIALPAEVTLSDGSIIFYVDVLLTGGVGTSSIVQIIDDPGVLPLQLFYNYGPGPDKLIPCTSPGAVAVNVPATFTVAGEIRSIDGGPTALVDVTLSNSGTNSPLLSTNTVSPGDYSFSPLNAGLNLRITPEKLTGWTRGVTAQDLTQIQRHIVGLDTLSNYNKVAADARLDGQVDGFDVVDLQILLGSLGAFPPPTNTSWRFAASKDTLADLIPLLVPSITTSLVINNLPADSLDNDFVAIKTGDVNESVDATQLTGGPDEAFSRSDEALTLLVKDQAIRAEEMISIEITAQNFNQLVAYQSVLDFNPELLSFEGFEKGALTSINEANFGQYHLDKGLLVMIWHQAIAADYQEDEVLFTLNFKALKDAESLRGLLSINQTAMTAGAWRDGALPMNVALEFTNATELTNFSLLQNQPNPFKTETVIGFYLPKASTATLQILDVSGRKITEIQGDYVAGYNELSISRSDLPAAGVLYYRLETADEVATKKMIVVE